MLKKTVLASTSQEWVLSKIFVILDLNDGSYWLLWSVIEIAIFIRNIKPDASRTIGDRLRSIL